MMMTFSQPVKLNKNSHNRRQLVHKTQEQNKLTCFRLMKQAINLQIRKRKIIKIINKRKRI